METLKQKADSLRSTLPKERNATPPQDSGIRLATFKRDDGEWRLSWNTFEGRPYVRLQFWTSGDNGFWPAKNMGLSIKIKELPDLGEGVQKALDMAIQEAKTAPVTSHTSKFEGTDLF
ncbi:MAG: hypothetical protein ACYCYP_01910 [Leptospirales bacterium]